MTTPIMGDGLPAPLLGMLGDEYQVFSVGHFGRF